MGQFRLAVVVLLVLCFLGGCSECGKPCGEQDKSAFRPAFDPTEQYPEWAYDAPFYYKPARDRGDVGEVVEALRPGGPPHFYVRDKTVFLPRPPLASDSDQVPEKLPLRTTEADLAPRVAVYWTDTGGEMWQRAGFFGLSQTHFAFPVENDGTYGFRFVGPTLPPAKCSPPRPEVVYHVDTVPPDVMIYIEPNQPSYVVNDSITVHWMVEDGSLADSPVSLSACWARPDSEDCEWMPIIYEQPSEGSMLFVVPPHGVGCCFKIRADARDRSGNLGVAFSKPLPVVEVHTTTQPTPTSNPAERIVTDKPGPTIERAAMLLGKARLADYVQPPERIMSPLRVSNGVPRRASQDRSNLP